MEGLSNLGIDGYSILIYIVNFGILVAVLTYFLYRPLLNFLDQRRDNIKEKIEAANKIKADFEKKLKEMESAKQKAQGELQDELAKMQKFVEEKRSELLASMEKEREEILSKTSKEIEKRKHQLVQEVEKELLTLMQKIVLEIVHNKVPENVIAESVNDAWKSYTK